MIDRKATFAAIALIFGMSIGALWEIAHEARTLGEVSLLKQVNLIYVVPPLWCVIFWFRIKDNVREYPNSWNLERSFRNYLGSFLVSACILMAFIQMLMMAGELGLNELQHNMGNLPMALAGALLVVVGNFQGKLPSPYKDGYVEPYSWDKMARFTGWTFVTHGFAILVCAFTLPDRAIFPSLAVLSLTASLLLMMKRYQLKQKKRRESL